MEDSSTNPYIPGSSDTLQRKVERPQTAFARISKTVLIIGGVLFLIIAIALIFILQNTTKVDDKARAEFANTLQPAEQLSKFLTIKSSLGFTVSYQSNLFTSFGELGASRLTARAVGDQAVTQSYEDNDLKKERDYGMVRITPIESSERARAAVALPPELEIKSYDKALLLQTDEQKAAEAENATNTPKGELAVSTFVAIDSKKRLADRTTDEGTIVSVEATKPVRQEIAGIEYQKVRYTTKNETHEITNEKYDDCYYTIQNSQAYSACVINVRPSRVAAASLLEDAVRLISYQAPVETTPEKPGATTSASTDEETEAPAEEKDTEQIAITPAYIKEASVLKAIAKNQPSVMRIGTLYCANIDLKRVDGSTGTTLTDACAGKVASGVFISRTGHIATAGHSVRFGSEETVAGYINMADSQDAMMDRLQRVLDYLLKSGLINQTTVEFLKTGASTGNQEALAKIENIGSIIPEDYVQARDESYNYALELTDKPIVINRTGNKPTFAYSDTVVKADFVRANYDVKKYSQDKFETSHSPADIAVLKAEGVFPVATIGSGNDLGANQKLATIGFPALVDGNLTGDKILNIPLATMSSVNQTFDLEGQKIIDVNTPIYPGNDGAPVFNEAAVLVGFAAYGPSYCPDRQCFGSGTVRSSNELSALIDKHNMEIENKSPISDRWSEGVDAYFAANYQTAASKFNEVGKIYGFNLSATPLAELAKSKSGSPSDTSLMNQLAGIGIGALIVIGIAMSVLGLLLFIHLKRLDMLQVGHYGTATPQIPQQPAAIQPAQQQPQPLQQSWQPYTPTPQATTGQQQAGPYSSPQVQGDWQSQPTMPSTQPQVPPTGAPQQVTPQNQPQTPYQPQLPQAPQPPQSDDPFYRQ